MADSENKEPAKAARSSRRQSAKTQPAGPQAQPAPARFKTGARPPKNAPALAFKRFRRHRPVESYPPVDYLARFAGWQMLGNDEAGDCVAVWWANGRRLVTGTLATEAYPDQDKVWELYRTQNPLFDPADPTSFGGPNDNGMEAQTLLEHLVKQGGPDGVKAVGFAKVDHTDLGEMKAAISTGGSLLLVVTVSQAQQDQFAAGEPWDYVERSETEGQHAVLAGGHTDEASGDLTIVTWGDQTELTDEFLRKAVVQAWLVIWSEHLGNREFLDGMDLHAFAAAYTEITGRAFPFVLHDAGEVENDAGGDLEGAKGEPESAPAADGAVDHAALDGRLLQSLAPILSGHVPTWQETFDMRTAVLDWAAGKEGEESPMAAEPEVNPDTAHRDDQRAQLDNEADYKPSRDARTRHLLEEKAEQADVRAAHQQEALDDLRQRESRSQGVRDHLAAEDEGRLTVADQERDPAYGGNRSEASGQREEISKESAGEQDGGTE